MSPWWILLVVSIVMVSGWHFMSRFLGRWVFPATTLLPGAVAAPVGRNALVCILSQITLLLGGGLFVSMPLASYWGWGPVMVWLLAGGFGICGITAAGLHFLDNRYPMDGFSAVSKDLIGRHGSWTLALLLQLAATLVHALLLVVASQLMALFPVAATLVLLHWLPLLLLQKTNAHRLGIYSIMILTVLWLLALPFASILPLRLAGEIHLLGGGDQYLMQSSNLWLLVLVALNGFVMHQGGEGVMLYRLTAGVLGVVVLLSGMFGLLTFPAMMVVPRVAVTAPVPMAPWLLVSLPAVTFGAWYMLSVTGGSRAAQRLTPIQGYTGAMGAVLAALVLMVLVGAGDAQSESMAWQPQQSLQYALSGALVRIAGHISQLGIPGTSSQGLTAFTAIVLLMSALQAGLRGQRILLNDTIEDMGIYDIHLSSMSLAAFTAGLALFILHGHGLADWWATWGVASALVSAGLLAMIGLALRRQQRAGGLVLCLGLLVWSFGQWAGMQGLLQHPDFWHSLDLLLVMLFTLGCWLMLACLQSWWKLRIVANKTPGKINLLLR